MRFIDEVEIIVVSGDGGAGCVSFRRERFAPRGGPDGGDGGHGGAVILEATNRRNTLQDFRRNRTYRARDGQRGRGRQQNGAYGDDLVLLVPVGTVIHDVEHREPLADLDAEGATWRLVGGKGGLGNVHFKSATRRTPRYAQDGLPGEEHRIRLELKLIADVGLLGYPNAGKSTLLSRISAARPRIGAHPFTTLVPQLGVVEPEPGVSFVVADIPGLIEGAAEGRGLGHQFLRHIERCALLLHLVTLETEEGDPVERYQALEAELRAYDPALLERPRLVVLTKVDLVDPETRDALLERLGEVANGPVSAVSSVSGEGLDSLVEAVFRALGTGQGGRSDLEGRP
ncbi:MAG: GTPase ObgE [Deltaproteobacteria bacterium]|nr:GTPase ObgE [Deltaproteobacteria bacterium]